jgi:hypothetical protein
MFGLVSHCQIESYQLLSGYGSQFGTDVLKRFSMLFLTLSEEDPDHGHGPIRSAVVSFGDVEAGPTTSVGQVITGSTASRVEVLLPRDELQTFRDAIPDLDFLHIAANDNMEVVEFVVFSSKDLPADQDPRARIEEMRQRLGAATES